MKNSTFLSLSFELMRFERDEEEEEDGGKEGDDDDCRSCVHHVVWSLRGQTQSSRAMEVDRLAGGWWMLSRLS